AQGLRECFEFPQSEMYGEPCDMPSPDELVFISWYAGGNASRSGYTYKRGAGKVFCFTPGHAWYDGMNRPEFQQVVSNAVRWARPATNPPVQTRGRIDSLEDLRPAGQDAQKDAIG
ncbi:MAG TPA: ThuA domain-containing protein, partial [Clostridia bacterium]|nr:ThuA domain-containing protein [Clostridia bacterium]